MPLLNYSTVVPVEKTLSEILVKLAKAGARSIQTDYAQGEPTALSFLIATPFGERSFRLPSNIDAVRTLLIADNRAGKVDLRFTSRQHAARVAWRIIKDWLEAQLAVIDAGQAELVQVMLPYAITTSGATVYEALTEGGLKLLAEGRRANA